MEAAGFISGKLRFKGKMAIISVAISFLIIIVSLGVASGFRTEIQDALASIHSDIMICSAEMDYLTDASPLREPSSMEKLRAVEGVERISPVVYRAGILKKDTLIQGALFKGVPNREPGLEMAVPDRISRKLCLEKGQKTLCYFVGENVKARNFTVSSIYSSLIESEDSQIILTSIEDLQRVNSWDKDQYSAFEVTLSKDYRSEKKMKEAKADIANILFFESRSDEPRLVATSVRDKEPQMFSWLELIDSNVSVILLLLILVAGFNMVSGLLILLFRNIKTIGILKSLGMTGPAIAGVFLRVAAKVVAAGMVAGNLLGIAFCLVQNKTHFLKLNPDNYFVDHVPVDLSFLSVLSTDLIAMVSIMVILLVPCLFISKVDPAKTVRFE